MLILNMNKDKNINLKFKTKNIKFLEFLRKVTFFFFFTETIIWQ